MGGILTMEDLARYNATAREPLFTTYNGEQFKSVGMDQLGVYSFGLLGFQVVTGPPPSSGAAMLFALNLLEGYNMNHTHASTPTYWHRMIEVSGHKVVHFISIICVHTLWHISCDFAALSEWIAGLSFVA